jgi:hypothetical protein
VLVVFFFVFAWFEGRKFTWKAKGGEREEPATTSSNTAGTHLRLHVIRNPTLQALREIN